MKRKILVLVFLIALLTATVAYSLNFSPKVLINNVEINPLVYNDEIYIPLSAVKYLGANVIEMDGTIIVQQQPTDLKEAYETMKSLDEKLAKRIEEYTEKISKAKTKENLKQLAVEAANETARDISLIENIVPTDVRVLLAKNGLHAMYNQALSGFMQQANAASGNKDAKELIERYQKSKAVGFQMSEMSFDAVMRLIEKQLLQEGKIQEQAY